MSHITHNRLLSSLVALAVALAAGTLPGLAFAIDKTPDFCE